MTEDLLPKRTTMAPQEATPAMRPEEPHSGMDVPGWTKKPHEISEMRTRLSEIPAGEMDPGWKNRSLAIPKKTPVAKSVRHGARHAKADQRDTHGKDIPQRREKTTGSKTGIPGMGCTMARVSKPEAANQAFFEQLDREIKRLWRMIDELWFCLDEVQEDGDRGDRSDP